MPHSANPSYNPSRTSRAPCTLPSKFDTLRYLHPFFLASLGFYTSVYTHHNLEIWVWHNSLYNLSSIKVFRGTHVRFPPIYKRSSNRCRYHFDTLLDKCRKHRFCTRFSIFQQVLRSKLWGRIVRSMKLEIWLSWVLVSERERVLLTGTSLEFSPVFIVMFSRRMF